MGSCITSPAIRHTLASPTLGYNDSMMPPKHGAHKKDASSQLDLRKR